MKATKQQKQQMREYYAANKQRWRKYRLRTPQEKAKRRQQERTWRLHNKKRLRELSAIRYKKVKNACFNAYGGFICACCKETIKQFLTIDHKKGGGKAHARKRKCAFYEWLLKNKFPKGYQVLCINCNLGRYINGGVCPHKERRK